MATVIYEAGLMEITVQVWDDINECYTGDPIKISGDHEFTYKESTSKTLLPSGDDAAYAVVQGAKIYEGTVSIYSLPQDLKAKLFAMVHSSKNGLMLGDSSATTPYVGIMADNQIVEDGVTSVNRVMFYRCILDEPEVTHETMSEDGPSTADLEISFKAYPSKYQLSDGTYAYRTGREVNSKENPEAYAALENGFSAPAESDLED